MVKVDNSILEAALVGLHVQRDAVVTRIAELQVLLLENGRKPTARKRMLSAPGLFEVPRKKLSDATRAKMAKAQKKRYLLARRAAAATA